MVITYLKKLNEFAKKHANARKSLETWKMVTEKADWKNKQQLLSNFPKAKILKNNRAKFENSHNTYRLIAYIHYEDAIVDILFIGTHNEYDKIDPETV